MDQIADLGDYAPLVITTLEFVDWLKSHAVIDAQTAGWAVKALQRVGEKSRHGRKPPKCAKFVLDSLAITHLRICGVLEDLMAAGQSFLISAAAAKEARELILVEMEEAPAVDTIEALRSVLRKGIELGDVRFKPVVHANEPEIFQEFPSLSEFLHDVGDADAIIIDDRASNKALNVEDRSGNRVPLLCITDLLRELEISGHLSIDERFQAQHAMRVWGFALIPLLPGELEHWLRSAILEADGSFNEIRELRAIREGIQRLHSTDVLQLPEESRYLEQLIIVTISAIRNMWANDDFSIDMAQKISNWIYREVYPSPWDWKHCFEQADQEQISLEGYAQLTVLLFSPLSKSPKRDLAYRDRVENSVVGELRPGASKVLDLSARALEGMIDEWSRELDDVDGD